MYFFVSESLELHSSGLDMKKNPIVVGMIIQDLIYCQRVKIGIIEYESVLTLTIDKELKQEKRVRE